MVAYEILRPSLDDWTLLRELRLRALVDTPLAYGESYEDALAVGDENWIDRVRRSLSPGNVQVVARTTDGVSPGRWMATMAGFVSQGPPPYALGGRHGDPAGERRANLVAVFVDPEVRGREAGVADGLLDAVIAWARDDEGLDQLHLHVHERNDRAAAFYRRRGFVATGEAFASAHGGDEQEMVLALR